MPLPLIPIVLGTVAGIGVEKGLNSIFNTNTGTKKGGGIANVYHEPYEVYSPTITKTQQIQLPSYQVAVDSPFARQELTKKQLSEPEIKAGVTQKEGLDMTLPVLAVIGIGALVVLTK